MFTGIVEEVGEIISISRGKDSVRLSIKADVVLEDVNLGDSISTNGVCLTVTKVDRDYFVADVMPETLRRSNLRFLKTGSKVNLERALKLSDRLGGHMVSGHVDGVAKVESRKQEGNAELFNFKIVEKNEGEISKYLVEKGSIAVDGISLTIMSCQDDYFTVSIIPHSKENTILAARQTGDYANLEVDIIGKYVEKLLFHEQNNQNGNMHKPNHSSLDINRMRELGY